jgi:hypothetical protein
MFSPSDKSIEGIPPSKKSTPVVAITFYSMRTSVSPGYHEGIFSKRDVDDVFRLKDGIQNAALERGQEIPTVEITLFLVPNWKEGETYTSEEYVRAKEAMLIRARDEYGEEITIIDFLNTNVTWDELDYLVGCESRGSIADLVKTRTIIDNAGRPCLQTDNNVTWANNNFAKLYDLTFLLDEDAFNSSRCSDIYVSAHNKLVFTGSGSQLPAIFQETLVEYCKVYKTDEWHKKDGCNGVYDFAFGEGMCRHGVTHRVRVKDKWSPGTFDFYPANLHDSRYKLMPLVIACQRESWRAGMPPPPPAVAELTGGLELSGGRGKKPAVEIEILGVKYGYYHFKSLVKVFTNEPSWHEDEDKHRYLPQTEDPFHGAEHARNLFVSKQDTVLCLTVFAEYYNKVKVEIDAGRMVYGSQALLKLAVLIPLTEAGDQLCRELFGCTAQELHDNPDRMAVVPDDSIDNHHQRFHLPVKPTYLQQRTPGFIGNMLQGFFTPLNRLDVLMRTESLKMIAKAADTLSLRERRQAQEFFKSLPSEQLELIKSESSTAQRVWDEQRGLILYDGPKG